LTSDSNLHANSTDRLVSTIPQQFLPLRRMKKRCSVACGHRLRRIASVSRTETTGSALGVRKVRCAKFLPGDRTLDAPAIQSSLHPRNHARAPRSRSPWSGPLRLKGARGVVPGRSCAGGAHPSGGQWHSPTPLAPPARSLYPNCPVASSPDGGDPTPFREAAGCLGVTTKNGNQYRNR